MSRRPSKLAAAVAAGLNPPQEGLPTMKVDFSTVLLDVDGAAIKDEENKVVTLAAAGKRALCAMTQASQSESGEAKFAAWELATKIAKGGKLDITPDEAVLLKTKINAIFSPAIVGPAFVLLNG